MNRLLSAATAAVVFGTTSLAAFAAPVSGWQMLYEADALPDATDSVWLTRQDNSVPVDQFSRPNWATGGTADATGGLLTVDTMGTDGSRYYEFTNIASPDFAPNASTGYTFETRVKLLNLDTAGTGAAVVFDFDEATSGVDQYWKLHLYDAGSGQYKAAFGDLYLTNPVVVDIDNTSFHTYRVTVQGTTGTLYVDGVEKGTSSIFTAVGTNALRFGDLTGADDGTFVVDYIRMNDTGAIAVPEPASLSAIGLAGLLLVRRRRSQM